MKLRPELPAFALAALVIIATAAITMSSHLVPGWFPTVAYIAAAGGAGIANPTGPLLPPVPPAPPAVPPPIPPVPPG